MDSERKMDSEKTIEVIERLKVARIGKYKKWESMIKKIKKNQTLNPEELKYYANITRIYKDSGITPRSRWLYHTKLSDQDEKPPCRKCKESSTYYCNINDEYFCTVHIVGHDENEF